MAAPQATDLIPPNVRVAVQQTIAPHADHLHHHGGPTEDDMLSEIRGVLVDHQTHGGLTDGDIRHIAAAATVILERRVIARRAA